MADINRSVSNVILVCLVGMLSSGAMAEKIEFSNVLSPSKNNCFIEEISEDVTGKSNSFAADILTLF